MPTYEYACRQCGEHLEVVQSFRDGPLTECPGCGGELRKVFSAAGLIFKGSGWHVKDYGTSRSSRSGGASSDTGASSDSGSKDSTSKDSTESKKDSDSSSSTSSSSTAEKSA